MSSATRTAHENAPTPLTGPECAPAGRQGADPRRRRRLGAFYTPDHVVQHMLRQLRGLDDRSRVLEPAAGDGAFALPLIRSGRIRPAQLTVCDLDPAATASLSAHGMQTRTGDTLLDPPRVAGGYTHVIGNPPYLGTHSEYVRSNRGALRARYADVGVNDTYAMFTLAGLRLLAPNGQLLLLVSDTFLTLGAHRLLRATLLGDYTLEALTLLPRSVFSDASVGTAILELRNAAPRSGHHVAVTDLRTNEPGDYGGTSQRISQERMRRLPAHEIVPSTEALTLLETAASCPPLMSLVEGGLGMYTRNNAAFIARVTHDPDDIPAGGAPTAGRGPSARLYETVPASRIDGTTWRAYHKRGGDRRWWAPVDHAIRWDADSQARYTIPATGLAGTDHTGRHRDGVMLSGVATRLTARRAHVGAMWESNKVIGLFPTDPRRLPPLALLALLNSTPYAGIAAALNHTVSLQYRDVARLPMLPARPAELAALADLGGRGVEAARSGSDDAPVLARVDAIAATLLARAVRQL